jgi:hypothetical protein
MTTKTYPRMGTKDERYVTHVIKNAVWEFSIKDVQKLILAYSTPHNIAYAKAVLHHRLLPLKLDLI